MPPEDREQAEYEAHNTDVLEQAVLDARGKAMRLTADDHVPEVMDPDTEAMVVKDEAGGVAGSALTITPRSLMDVASWRGKIIKPAGWRPRRSRSEWPWRVKPEGIPPAAWESIVEGWHCVRCLNPLEVQNADCACCGLTADLRAEGMRQLEQMGEVVYSSTARNRRERRSLRRRSSKLWLPT